MNGTVFPGMLSLGEAIRAQNKKSGVPMTMRGSDQVFKSFNKSKFTQNKKFKSFEGVYEVPPSPPCVHL
jgi:hypothetical protein